MTNWIKLFRDLLFYAYVGINLVRILVFDKYQRLSSSFKLTSESFTITTPIKLEIEAYVVAFLPIKPVCRPQPLVWLYQPFQQRWGRWRLGCWNWLVDLSATRCLWWSSVRLSNVALQLGNHTSGKPLPEEKTVITVNTISESRNSPHYFPQSTLRHCSPLTVVRRPNAS